LSSIAYDANEANVLCVKGVQLSTVGSQCVC
jgi:hypothetical protein